MLNRRPQRCRCRAIFSPGLHLRLHPAQQKAPFIPTAHRYERQTVEGWTVHVNKRLLTEEKELGERAIRLLGLKLYEASRRCPRAGLQGTAKSADLARRERWPRSLRRVSPKPPVADRQPRYNPDKAKCVEIFGNARKFLDWSLDQPMMILHELAHAYLRSGGSAIEVRRFGKPTRKSP